MAADTKTLDKIRALRREAANLAGFHSLYATKYASDSHCDKKGHGFLLGASDRWVGFSVRATFESYAGYYGSSSCTTILHVRDRDLVETAFIKAMNIHQQQLFQTTSQLLREEAASLTEKAETELAALRSLLDEAQSEPA